MSTPISIPCDLPSELSDGTSRAAGRLRFISRAAGFVQMESGSYVAGQPIRLQVPSRNGLPSLCVQAVIAQPLQRRSFPGEEPRTGVELAFLCIDHAFDGFLNALSESWVRSAAGIAPPPVAAHSMSLAGADDRGASDDTPTRPTMTRTTDSNGRERRAWTRRPAEVALRLWSTGSAAEGAALNFSEGGALIVTPAAVEPGALFRMEVDVPMHGFACEAQVVRMQGTQGGADQILGVRFLSMRELLGRIPPAIPESGESAAPLTLDLRNREELVATYLRHIKQGTLVVPTRSWHPAGAKTRVQLLLPAPMNAFELEARVQRADASGGLVLELLEPESVQDIVHKAIGSLCAA